MIVVMQSSATGEHIQAVIEQMVELGFNVHRTSGAGQMILVGVGTPDQFDVTEFQVMSGVQDACLGPESLHTPTNCDNGSMC